LVADKNLLLDDLLKNKKISEKQYKNIIELLQKNPKEDALELLYKNGYITKEDYLKYLSSKYSIGYISDLSSVRLKNISAVSYTHLTLPTIA
jgi:ribosomal protein S8